MGKEIKKDRSEYTIHIVGHSHIDPVWQWTKEEGYQAVLATFRSALDRLAEFPEVCFVASSAQFYEWVQEADPQMFKEIVARVKEGRWVPVGGWWVEADCNCPSGESLVRQGLYAQKFFRKHFGRIAIVAFAPDTFGHPYALPQMLTKQGMNAYIFMRPEMHETDVIPAPLFSWQGPDGSTVTAVAIIAAYFAPASEIEERIRQTCERFAQTLPQVHDVLLFYGVGNHGGGPTIAAIQKLQQLSRELYRGIRHSTPEIYLQNIRRHRQQLPHVRTELQHHARGCYSACAPIKALDRRTTYALIVAEKIASLAKIATGYPYPQDALTAAWKKCLFNQFHDILAGTSIEQAYIDAAADYGYAQSVAQDVMIKAFYALSSAVDTKHADYQLSSPFMVLNPCSWPVSGYVEFETDLINVENYSVDPTVWRNAGSESFPKEMILLRDAGGTAIPYQVLPTAAVKQENQPYRMRLLFRATVPTMGYQVYRLDYGRQQQPPKNPPLRVDKTTLENDHVRISFDANTGSICSYFNKRLNVELLRAPAAALVLEDGDDTWGHRIRAYDRELGRFAEPTFEIIEQGGERVGLQVTSRWGRSTLVQQYYLYRESPEIEVRVTVDWHEKYKVLKLSWPTVLTKGCCTYSIPYGFIERPMNGDEEPGQAWVDVSYRNRFGFAVINDSKCGYSVHNGDIRLTVLRSTAWSHHHPEVVNQRDPVRYMDQGIHEFSYLVYPHAGDWRQANVPRRAEPFLMPLLTLPVAINAGHLPAVFSFYDIDAKNVSLTVLKKAEDSDDLVLRLVELHGEKTSGHIEMPYLKKKVEFSLNGCEIKTLIWPITKSKKTYEANLLEDRLQRRKTRPER